jgi:hypothetical protein
MLAERSAQFNARIKQGRCDVVCSKVRAVCMTVMDDNKLVRASKLCPDDRAEHFHHFLRDHLQQQLERKAPLTRAVYVDDVGKYMKGYGGYITSFSFVIQDTSRVQ